jgi:hypothetical protein
MRLTPYVRMFPTQGTAETRVVTVRGHTRLPDDDYALTEAYCPDPACDCRRVMLSVAGRGQPERGFLAAIGFGFDRDGEWSKPFLDPINPQSEHAAALLEVVTNALADPVYVKRLEKHYRQVKRVVKDGSGKGVGAAARKRKRRARRRSGHAG